jgi:hypothetical protein
MTHNIMRRAPHNIARAEWIRRFTARVESQLALTADESTGVVPGELEGWPDDPDAHSSDWREWLPEEAADENLSYWTE